MGKETQSILFLQQGQNGKVKDDMPVHLTIHNVPASLIQKFTQEVVRPFYPIGKTV